MKKLLITCLLFLPLFTAAREYKKHVVYLTKDSLEYRFEDDWRFYDGDVASFSAKDAADSNWRIMDSQLLMSRDSVVKAFTKGICWFRLHLSVDTSLAGKPLALMMTHYGASEVYFDGNRLKTFEPFGRIKGKDSSDYYDPQFVPFVVTIPDTGEHVLAIRYANYDAKHNHKRYNRTLAGFKMTIDEVNRAIHGMHRQLIAISVILLVLSSLFVAFSLLHFFLYLYNRSVRSNLYFSIFTLSMGLLFFIPYLNRVTGSPAVEFTSAEMSLFLLSLGCFALSGLINELFSKNKLRFRIISLLCLVPPLLWYIDKGASLVGYIAIVIAVMFESALLTVIAIVRKVKGAKIIGVGILFFTLFILTILIIGLIFGDFSIDERTLTGQIVEITAACAILSIPLSMSAYLAASFSRINKDLAEQLVNVKMLSEKTIEQEQEKKRLLESRQEELEREVAIRTEEVTTQKEQIEKQHEELKAEKKKSDDLLRNILPEEVAEELKEKGSSDARYFDMVTVLFTDFVDFTKAGEKMTPQELVSELDTCFKVFDDIIALYDIEKIKTIGDAYLAVSGLPVASENHAINVVRAAIDILRFMKERKARLGDRTFDIRIGVHSGPVVAGIVGVKKFAYDIWGDTVNTAARMEQNSEAGKINISETTYDIVKEQFNFTYRGEIDAKNKGMMRMYFVDSLM